MNGIVLSRIHNTLKVVLYDGHVQRVPMSHILQSAPGWAHSKISSGNDHSGLPPGLSSSTLVEFQSANIAPKVLHSIRKVEEESTDLMVKIHSNFMDLTWPECKSLDQITRECFKTELPSFEQTASVLKILFKKSVHYYPVDPHASHPLYHARDVKTISFYLDIFGKSQFEPLVQFIDKCTRIITCHRSGTRHKLTFSNTDLQLIQILKTSLFYPSRFPCPERQIALNYILPKLQELYSKKLYISSIVHLLKELGVWSPWENFHRQNPLYSQFLLPTPDPVKDLEVKDDCDGIRRDVGQLPVYVIDGMNAHELDDGISLEVTSDNQHWIHIHIADPTRYLSSEDIMSIEARRRIFTVYNPETTNPMLSPLSVKQAFNLTASNNAMTFSAKLDSNGDVLDYKISPTRLNNFIKTTYSVVDSVLDWSKVDGGYKSEQWMDPFIDKYINPRKNAQKSLFYNANMTDKDASTLQTLQKLAWKHGKYRASLGGIHYQLPSTEVTVNPYPLAGIQPKVKSNYFQKGQYPTLGINPCAFESPARSLVAECMIIAGRVAAMYSCHHNVPVIYRGHSAFPNASPNFKEIIAKRDSETGIIPVLDFYQHVMPWLSSSSEETRPINHFSMGILGNQIHSSACGYVKVTSPLRRYTDLIAHWNIKSSLLKRNTFPIKESQIKDWIPEIKTRETLIKHLSRKSDYLWKAEWMRRRETWIRRDIKWRNELLLPPDHYGQAHLFEFEKQVDNIQYDGIVFAMNPIKESLSVFLPELGHILNTIPLGVMQMNKYKIGSLIKVRIEYMDSSMRMNMAVV